MTKKVTETKYGWYMENEKTKVELEDIVGLVQTDDSTNSVQLKKEAQLSICEKRLIELEKENEQLKKDCSILVQSNQEYRKENEQLKQRNDRQAKQLAELYELMAKKDWESLTEIIDDFCSCEEQLQRESGTYGGFE